MASRKRWWRVVGIVIFSPFFCARQLNLPRFVRHRSFVSLHEVTRAWLDRHFDVLEDNAPWLHRIGAEVYDHCSGGVTPYMFRNVMAQRSVHASMQCHRQVTVVYGFDVAPDPLAEALSIAGWERYGPDGLAEFRWRPSAALGHPPGLAETPPWGRFPLSPSIRLFFADDEQNSEWRIPPPRRAWRATREYLPMEVSEASASTLLSEALKHHAHALAVTIDLRYYENPDARRRPHRVPRYLVPAPQAGGHSDS